MAELADGSLAGDVMRACLRRGVKLSPRAPGAIDMDGPKADCAALEKFVKEFRPEIFRLLTEFERAQHPIRFARMH